MLMFFLGLLMLAPSVAADISKDNGRCTAGSACIEDEMSFLQFSLSVQEEANCNAVKLVTLAQMANISYELDSNTEITSTSPEITAEGFQVADAVPQPEYQIGGVFLPAYAVWTRDAPCKQAVLAIKGTSLNSLTDIRADAKNIFVGVDPTTAKEKLGKVVDKYERDGYVVLVTGHSLGGFMGEIMSTTKNLPGAVFNAPGPDGYLRSYNGPSKNADFHVVNAEIDPIGNLKFSLWLHKSWPIYVVGDHSHSILRMIDALEQKAPDATNVNVLKKCSDYILGYHLNLLDGANMSVANMSARLPGYYLE